MTSGTSEKQLNIQIRYQPREHSREGILFRYLKQVYGTKKLKILMLEATKGFWEALALNWEITNNPMSEIDSQTLEEIAQQSISNLSTQSWTIAKRLGLTVSSMDLSPSRANKNTTFTQEDEEREKFEELRI